MSKPVIVYGASGYTGRLVCEYLREYNVPFVAAGRDKARIAEAMDKVPGIDTIEHDIVEVSHDVEPLSVMQAYGAYSLLQQRPLRTGFASGCQAFGHRELLGAMRSFGLVMEPDLTVHH